MTYMTIESAWQLSEDRRRQLYGVMPRGRRRRRPRPPVDRLPGGPDAA